MIQNRANERAYIKDIAAELGVSSKTVSRALRRGSAPTGKPAQQSASVTRRCNQAMTMADIDRSSRSSQ